MVVIVIAVLLVVIVESGGIVVPLSGDLFSARVRSDFILALSS